MTTTRRHRRRTGPDPPHDADHQGDRHRHHASTSTAAATVDVVDRHPLLRPHAEPARAATAGSTCRSQATGDLEIDAHHTVEDVGILLGEVFARGAGRQGRRAPLRVQPGAARRGAGRRRARPVGSPVPPLRDRLPRREDPRRPAVRPPAGGGVLAGLRDGVGHHAAHHVGARARTPTTSSRPSFKAVARSLRDAVRVEGTGHAVDQGHAVTGRPGPADADARRAAMTLIAVLDYGIGNLRSAQKALEHVGADARLTADPGLIRDAAAVVLPGVGRVRSLHGGAPRPPGSTTSPTRPSRRGRPFLGICVGMQLLYEASEESPGATGLGILPGTVRRLPDGVKRPQMQWNMLDIVAPSPLFEGLDDPAWMYFVHSFAAERRRHTTATCDYGGPVVAAVEHGNVLRHPVPPREVGPQRPHPARELREARRRSPAPERHQRQRGPRGRIRPSGGGSRRRRRRSGRRAAEEVERGADGEVEVAGAEPVDPVEVVERAGAARVGGGDGAPWRPAARPARRRCPARGPRRRRRAPAARRTTLGQAGDASAASTSTSVKVCQRSVTTT